MVLIALAQKTPRMMSWKNWHKTEVMARMSIAASFGNKEPTATAGKKKETKKAPCWQGKKQTLSRINSLDHNLNSSWDTLKRGHVLVICSAYVIGTIHRHVPCGNSLNIYIWNVLPSGTTWSGQPWWNTHHLKRIHANFGLQVTSPYFKQCFAWH